MTTVKEDYCSYEIAKLLKEAGFDGDCRARYDYSGSLHYEKYPIESSGAEMHNSILCSTHQMAMKWLREACGLIISIEFQAICLTWKWRIYIKASNKKHTDFQHYNKYEEAVEAAVNYALKNLI